MGSFAEIFGLASIVQRCLPVLNHLDVRERVPTPFTFTYEFENLSSFFWLSGTFSL